VSGGRQGIQVRDQTVREWVGFTVMNATDFWIGGATDRGRWGIPRACDRPESDRRSWEFAPRDPTREKVFEYDDSVFIQYVQARPGAFH